MHRKRVGLTVLRIDALQRRNIMQVHAQRRGQVAEQRVRGRGSCPAGGEALVFAVVDVERAQVDLEPTGHCGEALQRVVAKAREKAGRSAVYRDTRVRVGAALCPRRGDPVHQPRREVRIGLRFREFDPSILLV